MTTVLQKPVAAMKMTRTSLIRLGLAVCAIIILAAWWYTSGNASLSVTIAGGRGKGEPETGTNHVGFRLVRDVDKQKAARS